MTDDFDEPRPFALDESTPPEAEPFNISAPKSGSDGIPKTAVYYDPERDAAIDVLERYFEENPKLLDVASEWGLYERIFRRYDEQWREAAYELLGPFEGRASDGACTGTCGICGEEYRGSYAAHYMQEHAD